MLSKTRIAVLCGILFLVAGTGWYFSRREASAPTPAKPATASPAKPRRPSEPGPPSGIVPPPSPSMAVTPPDEPAAVSPRRMVAAAPPAKAAPPPAPPSSAPAPGVGADTPEERAAAAIDLDQVSLMLRDYRTRMGDNPVGTNAEIMRAVMGGNPKGARLGPPEGQELNGLGELVDRWGTALFFHQISATHTEIHSAGPDRTFGTDDDIVMK